MAEEPESCAHHERKISGDNKEVIYFAKLHNIIIELSKLNQLIFSGLTAIVNIS